MREHLEFHSSAEWTLVARTDVYNKILVSMKNKSLRKVSSVKKYAWVLQQKDKMGTVFTTQSEAPSFFASWKLLFAVHNCTYMMYACLLLHSLLYFFKEGNYFCLSWFHPCSIYWSYVNSKLQPVEIFCSGWSSSTLWYGTKLLVILIIHLCTKYQISRCKE